jgi:hypothetical protein
MSSQAFDLASASDPSHLVAEHRQLSADRTASHRREEFESILGSLPYSSPQVEEAEEENQKMAKPVWLPTLDTFRTFAA